MLSDSIYTQLGIYIFCKDRYGKFLFCNDLFAEAAGLDSCFQIIGKTDRDLIWHKDAPIFEKGDQLTMIGQKFINVSETTHTSQKKADILVSKYPLYSKNNNCIGLIGSFIDISGHTLRIKRGRYDEETQRFYLDKPFENEFLTKQQYNVFKKILLGFSAKQISQQLRLSPRTVESHINNIKHKFSCNTKGQIIELAIKYGLNYLD